MKYSVIIPVYNNEQYIKKCINSVLEQTYDNYEIIVINDGSKDNSINVINEYKDNDKIIIIDKDNSGVSDTRNIGITKATGDYITFLDSDDYLYNDALERINNIIKKKEYDVIQGNLTVVYGKKESMLTNLDSDLEVQSKEELLETLISIKYGEKKYGNKYGNCRCSGAKFYKTKLIKKNKIRFPINISSFEDGIFNLYAFYYANSILIMKDSIYYYRFNENSETHNYIIEEKQANKNVLILENIKKFLEEYNIESLSYNYCFFDLLLVYINNLVGLNISVKETIKYLKKYINNNNYNECFKAIEYSNLKGKDKIFYFSLKNKLYVIAILMYKIKIFIRNK